MLKCEQETVIRWDSEEQVVWVDTLHPIVKRKIEKAGYTPLRLRKHKGKEIGWFYKIPLDQFRWRIGRLRKTGGKDIRAILADKKSKEGLL